MKALVTGATGFIGGHLVAALVRQGFDVSCLARKSSSLDSLEGLDVNIIRGDCSDPDTLRGLEGFDYVFHCAGQTKAVDLKVLYMVNEQGVENLIRAVRRDSPGLRRFVYLSSLAAAGPSRDGRPLKEDAEPSPVSEYGKSKLGGERHVLAVRDSLPFTIIRPPAVYGPRDRDLFLVFRMVDMGLALSWGKSYYSFVYVEELVNGIILSALKEEGAGEIFFISDGAIYSSDDIIDSIAEALGRSPLKVPAPRFMLPLLGAIGERLKGCSIMNADKVREIRHTHWICDTGKAVDKLGYSPKTTMREGARWTAEWYRIHKWL
jgi:nucleoside-diphosphate-sugar epimerase